MQKETYSFDKILQNKKSNLKNDPLPLFNFKDIDQNFQKCFAVKGLWLGV